MNLSEDQLVEVIHRLLEVGVPPTAIAKAFSLEPQGVRDLQAHIRRELYGTEELTEAMTFLIWHAYEQAIDAMDQGTPATKIRMTTQILARPLAIAGRQTPESLDKMRDLITRMATEGLQAGVEEDEDEEDFVVARG